jgi:hypothetical protein
VLLRPAGPCRADAFPRSGAGTLFGTVGEPRESRDRVVTRDFRSPSLPLLVLC